MKKSITSAAIAALLAAQPTWAADGQKLMQIFDGVCVGTLFEEARIEKMVRAVASQLSMEFREIPKDMARTMGDGVKSAWLISNGKDSYVPQYSEKPDGKSRSLGCVVTATGMRLADIQGEVEKRFRVTKVDETTQGFSRFVVYLADLIGISDRVAIGIQEMSDGNPTNAMVSLSLYQVNAGAPR